MATLTRSRPLLRAALLTALAAGGAPSAAEDPASPLERLLQGRYLDRPVYLRADVKIRTLEARQVVISTWPRRADLSSVKPGTLITADGVFYLDDYGTTRELEMDVRPGFVVDPEEPAQQNQTLIQGGTIGDVVELERASRVVLPAGSLARIVGVEETPLVVRVLLEGLNGKAVPVLVRDLGDAAEAAAGRAERFGEILDSLAWPIPDDPARRRAAMDPAWKASLRQAIAEGRVGPGMTGFQVLLAWGMPVHVSRDPESDGEIWLYSRGGTIREQMRGRSNVYLVGGKVVDVEPAGR